LDSLTRENDRDDVVEQREDQVALHDAHRAVGPDDEFHEAIVGTCDPR